MAKTDELVPEDFLMYLQKHIPGFRLEALTHQWAMALMIWESGASKSRRHSYFEGAASYSYQELAQKFGRTGFKAVNDRLGLIDVSSNYSMEAGYTYGFWLSDKGQRVHDTYLRRQWRKATEMIRVSGRRLEVAATLPAVISSTDLKGKTLSAQSSAQWQIARHLNLTPINLDSLKRLRRWYEWRLDDIDSGRLHPELFPATESIEHLRAMTARLHAITAKIIRQAITSLAGIGHINQRYFMAPSGRLFAKGVSLQSAPTVVKQAALHGLWEYDFSNCHYAIVRNMAARFGMECTAIDHYLKTKKVMRVEIAKKVGGITPDEAKDALLAMLYGAKAGTDPDFFSIPEVIGEEAAERLYALPEFKEIKEEIQEARRLILDKWPKTSNGRLVNDFGKAISVKETPARRLAHLVQGAEAKALNAAIHLYPHSIVLVQHDGFTSTIRLHTRAVEDAVEAALGYRLTLEEEQLQPDPEAQYMKAAGRQRQVRRSSGSKTQIARRARPGAGFRDPDAS